jgi:hypothetical protein
VKVDPDVLFVDEGDLITSAGTAAGIDACLHLVRRELGSSVATAIARRMVVPPQRDGGQRQFVELPIPECTGDSLQFVLAWMLDNLAEEHTVAKLARRAQMSERTFARRFVAETGHHPAQVAVHPAGAARQDAAGGHPARHRGDRARMRFRHGRSVTPPFPPSRWRFAARLPPRLREHVRHPGRHGL